MANDHTQRIRIGITGLACVLLVVLFAAAVVGFQTRDAAQADNQVAATNQSAEPPTDPLGELGVAPGGQPTDPAVPADPPPPAP